MAVQGPFTWFDYAIAKFSNSTIDLDSHNIYAVLTGATQTISRTFVGTSTDCRYSDLTNELPTANGYTLGGVALSGNVISRPSTNVVKFTANTFSWTITSSITFKYCILYDNSNANKDLIAFCDFDTTSGSSVITIGASTLQVIPNANGILTITQP